MSAKILKTLLMLSGLLILTGCSTVTKTEYVNVPYPVPVIEKCKVPEVFCDFNKPTDTEVIKALTECIVDLRESIKVCQ